jgi:sugar (glycoside-pentoside-hexuronide) transporter
MKAEVNQVNQTYVGESVVGEKVKLTEKLSYGVGALGKDLFMGMLAIYLMVYLTDVFGISAAAAGGIFLVARIWDAINDPIMGVIVDKTNTRWGRFRPYILFSPIVMGISMIALFTVPDVGMNAKIIYAGVAYIMVGMAFTAYDVPTMSLAPAITKNTNERTSLLASSRFFTQISFAVIATFALPLVGLLGNGDSAKGYQLLVILLAIISVVCAWITFANVKERNVIKNNKNSFKDYVNIIKSNKPFAFIMALIIPVFTVFILEGSVRIYFMIYVLQRPDLIPTIMGISTIVPLFFAFFIPKLTAKFGKKQTAIALCLIGSLSTLARFFIWENITALYITTALFSVSFMAVLIVATSMLSDTVDYSEWKTGKRSEGIIFSLNSFAIKVGQALAGGLAGFLLTAINYVPNAAQSAETLTGLNVIFSLVSAIGFMIPIFFLHRYNLTEEKYKNIILELEERRA